MKALKHLYPSMRLCHLSALSLARVNGTYSIEDPGGKYAKTAGTVRSVTGKAFAADPILQGVISKLCSVRSTSLGKVTELVKGNYGKDCDLSATHRKKHREDQLKEAARKAAGRMEKTDAAMEVEIIETKNKLLLELAAISTQTGKIDLLSLQYDRRMTGEKRQYKQGDVPSSFRNKHGKILKWPEKGGAKLPYIQQLVLLMIKADVGRTDPAVMAMPTNLVRRPPTIAPQHTSALSIRIKAEQLVRVKDAAAPKDDPIGGPLLAKYKSKLFYENDVPKRKRRTYKIMDVGYKQETSEWVTCSVPVEKSEGGVWEIPVIHLVDGGSSGIVVVKDKAYEYHVLADVSDPTNVLYGDCVDTYIAAHLSGDGDKGTTPQSEKSKKRKRK